jgi:hypothetical protein
VLKITAFYGRVSLRFVDRPEIERFDPDGAVVCQRQHA